MNRVKKLTLLLIQSVSESRGLVHVWNFMFACFASWELLAPRCFHVQVTNSKAHVWTQSNGLFDFSISLILQNVVVIAKNMQVPGFLFKTLNQKQVCFSSFNHMRLSRKYISEMVTFQCLLWCFNFYWGLRFYDWEVKG